MHAGFCRLLGVLDSVHLAFDLLAYTVALVTFKVCSAMFPVARSPIPSGFGLFYLVVASSGAMIGSFALGTVNVVLAGVEATLAKSVLGALIGGTVAIELMKWRYQIKGSTGALLVPGIALGIAVGRIGCFYAGLNDYTYGTPTSLAMGVDFGDGIQRHPVQLYEAIALVLFLIGYLRLLALRRGAALAWGFYLFCGFYGAQRFAWEFLKPYPTVLAGMNIFQFGCVALVGYAAVQFRLSRHLSTGDRYESA
ncbi:MAG: prolipoprotein diacylglyceryl transferase [Pseudomonadales bacterium]